jgi:hypothetical protein
MIYEIKDARDLIPGISVQEFDQELPDTETQLRIEAIEAGRLLTLSGEDLDRIHKMNPNLDICSIISCTGGQFMRFAIWQRGQFQRVLYDDQGRVFADDLVESESEAGKLFWTLHEIADLGDARSGAEYARRL